MPELRDVSTDQQNQGLAANLVIDRDTASRLGVSTAAIDQVLYDAFGQRQVSTMYTGLNQYFVVMEVDPQYQLSPDALDNIYVKASNGTGAPTAMSSTTLATPNPAATTAAASTTFGPAAPRAPGGAAVFATAGGNLVTESSSSGAGPAAAASSASSASASVIPAAAGAPVAASTGGAMVPLSAFAHYQQKRTSLAVNHQGQYPAVTLTFNLAPNVALGDAVTALEKAQREMGMPSTVHATFQGTAQAFQDSLRE